MTGQMNIFDLIRERKAGDIVETYGRELAFDELPDMKGRLIVISKDTVSTKWRVVVRVVDVIWNSYEGCRRLIYSEGGRQRGMVDERYFKADSPWRVRIWET